MPFVLDSSAALAFLLPDEHAEAVDAIAEELVRSSAQAPAIWPLEVRNALLAALRSRRLAPREFDERVAVLNELPVEIDPGTAPEALSRTVDIARRQGLTAYDASYLELAKRLGLPLASLDARMRKAGSALRVRLLP